MDTDEIMNERHMKLGQLSELRRELQKLENLGAGTLQQLRMEAMPTPLGSPYDIDAQKIVDYAEQYQSQQIEAKRIREAITKLAEELGE